MVRQLRKGLLLGIGNPLLDISVNANKELLEKYNLSENNAILADDSHKSLYTELLDNPESEYFAGGSVQSTLRVFQWLMPEPEIASFFGSVGKDRYAEILEKKARSDGVNVQYQKCDDQSTGTCAVLISGKHRSLCANLAAANCFTVDHILDPANAKIINMADYFYISGFFLTVNQVVALEIAQIAMKSSKTYAMNLSAPFICGQYRDRLVNLLPYVTLLFGNEQEALTLAKEEQFGTTDLKEIAVKVANYSSKCPDRGRMFVLTHGEKPIIIGTYGSDTVQEFDIDPIPDAEIVDTNGAGDAFVGGFLSQFVQEKSIVDCVKCGTWAARQIIKQSGCSFSGPANYDQCNS